jgi:polysaccharide biosynthesis protein PslA
MDAAAGFGMPFLAMAQFSAEGSRAAPVIFLTAALALFLIGMFGGYSPRLLQQRAAQVPLVIAAGLTAIGATALAAWVFEAGRIVNASWVGPAAASGILTLAGGRALAGWLLARHRDAIASPRTVVVGGGPTGVNLMLRLMEAADRGPSEQKVRLLGYVDGRPTPKEEASIHPPYLGGLAELLGLIRAGDVDRVIIALPWSAQAPVLELISQLAECPIQIQLARDPKVEFVSDRRHFDRELLRTGLLHVMDPPVSGLASLVKRSEDLAIASIVLLPALPLLAAIAVAIRLDSPGPVLFRQSRTGFNNRDFQMWKFRTMHHHLADPEARSQTIPNDPRVTRVGGFLRRTSLDELPQIFNVLRGDMSIVGPRPHAPGTRAGGRVFDQVVGDYAARHRVRPGVTGLAQVRGLRGPTETEDKLVSRVDSDLEYIENWSLWLDLRVLAQTFYAVLRMKNAC